MGIIELLLLAIGLSMDAFAVSICKGIETKKASVKQVLLCGIWFGGFQGLMPLIGYLLGTRFETLISKIAPWLAFILLCLIGVNMIKEAFSSEEEETRAGFDVKSMFLLAVATSIDALAVGLFADYSNDIYLFFMRSKDRKCFRNTIQIGSRGGRRICPCFYRSQDPA